MDNEGQAKVNILIIKLSAIGDVIHTLPSLSALRGLYPDADITWVIEEASSDIIKDHPLLDRVIVSRRKKWMADLKKLHGVSRTIREIRTFISRLRDRQYDLVIDFHGLFKSSLIVLLSGGKRKLGYDSMQELSGLFLNEKIHEDMGKHAVDRYLDFLRHLGSDTGDKEFLIPIQKENKDRVEKLLNIPKIDIENKDCPTVLEGSMSILGNINNIDIKKRFVAVNPMAFWETKLWEDEKFAGLCDRITKELRAKVVFTGGGGDGMIEHIQSLMSHPSVNLGGKTTLKDLAYLYKLASLVITTDSGPMHIAAAMRTPVVALFGPTDPLRTGPYGEGHVVIRKEMPCSPCFLKKCDSRKCMKEITA
ncbi:MAG: glycosyltransferase family 9 protein, partial [Proteobacteria bacterium]|nr:glycosyltransferase family 9 protein [Pseudomonadota bacterium]